MSKASFVEVAFPIPLNKTFHYQAEGTQIGARVLAPFGPKKNLVGFVVGRTSEKPHFQTKAIAQWIDDEPFLDDKLIELARWVSDRYLCSLGEALACVVPPALAAPKRPPKNIDENSGPEAAQSPKADPFTLTPEQTRALEPLVAALDARRAQSFLLHGITNSGKTELYLRAMDRVIAQGRQALFLLPEIALTPPFMDQLPRAVRCESCGNLA